MRRYLKLPFFIALVGLIGMIISAGSITPREVKIKEINKGMIDEKITVTGFVEDIKKSKTGRASFITLNDGTGRVTIVIFESVKNEIERSNLNMEMLKYKK